MKRKADDSDLLSADPSLHNKRAVLQPQGSPEAPAIIDLTS
jgi:hypothetical protein